MSYLKILDPKWWEKLATFYIYEAYSVILKEIRRQKKEVENRLFNETDYEIVKRLKGRKIIYISWWRKRRI